MNTTHKVATGVMKYILKLLKADAFTSLWNIVYYKDETCIRSMRLKKHELCHINQMKRDGKFVFTIKYLYYNFKVGYWKNPYEIEARESENV